MKTPPLTILLVFVAASALAQLETLPPETEAAWLARFNDLAAKPPAPIVGAHFKRLADAPAKVRVNAARVADAFAPDAFSKGFVAYDVPAMAETMRLPDAYPFDGVPGAPVRIVSALGEYEPGSFVIYPLASHGKVDFTVGDLKSADGAVFPAAALDLKVVKVWYQAGNAWIGYFQDTGFTLCPELLLHPGAAAFGEFPVPADLPGADGLRQIVELRPHAGGHVKGDHIVSSSFLAPPTPKFCSLKEGVRPLRRSRETGANPRLPRRGSQAVAAGREAGTNPRLPLRGSCRRSD